MKHLHWIFVAYDLKRENGMIDEATEVTVTDQPIEALALEQAKKIIVRKHYWLKQCWECSICGAHDVQLKFMKEMLKRFKGHDHPPEFSPEFPPELP